MVACVDLNWPIKTRILQLSRGYNAHIASFGSGAPLVLVPGLAGGIELVEPLAHELGKRFRVHTYELRGERDGLFDRTYHLPQLAQDLGDVIGELGLERPGVVGISFGGAIALEYALRQPERLGFLAVQGTGPVYKPGIFGDVARRVLDTLPLPADSPFINQFFSLLIGQRRSAGDRFEFIVDRSWATDQSVMAYRLALLDHFDISERVQRLRVPTLVIGGERDLLVSPEDARRLAKLIPRGVYREIPDGGHLSFVTHTEELVQHLTHFPAAISI